MDVSERAGDELSAVEPVSTAAVERDVSAAFAAPAHRMRHPAQLVQRLHGGHLLTGSRPNVFGDWARITVLWTAPPSVAPLSARCQNVYGTAAPAPWCSAHLHLTMIMSFPFP